MTINALRPPIRRLVSHSKLTLCTISRLCSSAKGLRKNDQGDVSTNDTFFRKFHFDDCFRGDTVYSLSFASDALESDLASDEYFPVTCDRMKRQIRQSFSSLRSQSTYNTRLLRSFLPPRLQLDNLESVEHHSGGETLLPPLIEDAVESISTYQLPLPKSIDEINPAKLDGDARAIVVTDTNHPFRIINVNTAWEGLCGYSRDECKGKSLGALLQGPDTDGGAVTALVAKLLSGEEAGAEVTNYTKSGKKFRNDLRVRPVLDEMGKTVSFVGVLREVIHQDEASCGGNIESGYLSGREKSQLPFMS